MARTKEMSFSIGMKINTGNYSNISFDVAETVELDKADDPAAVYNDLRARCIKRLIEQKTALGQ